MALARNRRAMIMEIAIKLERFTKQEISEECYKNGLYGMDFIATAIRKAIEQDVTENIQRMTVPNAHKIRRFASVIGKRKNETVQEFVLREKMTHDDWVSENLSAKQLLMRIKNRTNNTVKYARRMLGLQGKDQKCLPPAGTINEFADRQLALFELTEVTRDNGKRNRRYI